MGSRKASARIRLAVRRVDDVIEIAAMLVPEARAEARARLLRGVRKDAGAGAIAEARRQRLHDGQRVVPERVDLDWFARARCHHPVADLRVHPGELYAGLT